MPRRYSRLGVIATLGALALTVGFLVRMHRTENPPAIASAPETADGTRNLPERATPEAEPQPPAVEPAPPAQGRSDTIQLSPDVVRVPRIAAQPVAHPPRIEPFTVTYPPRIESFTVAQPPRIDLNLEKVQLLDPARITALMDRQLAQPDRSVYPPPLPTVYVLPRTPQKPPSQEKEHERDPARYFDYLYDARKGWQLSESREDRWSLQLSYPTYPYSQPSDGHWVQQVRDMGRYVVLEDGGIYEVDVSGQARTATWLPTDRIRIEPDPNSSRYRLVNMSRGESVWVNPSLP